ncbi:glycosyl hydrolase family 28-related protein [Chryseobacterium fluminis]|uniref:glycosyl hydrolase family 28-related protein n=1 Tax=Chryseobacterium fluminis TaxID=2983606 RepID=UPI0022559DFC|nr:glycosyl hydrolase family 28-related protein [Chryseobacterium sp. MMS21-Ot14]UZT99694.1 glycosyl hydrolase family 28-related protein [Chryseobacterium sp. MMS21-Ot14]
MKGYSTILFLIISIFAYSQNIDIKTYGAKGDGLSDDTKAFTNAVNDIKAKYSSQKKHVNLYLPSGTYLISKPIVLNKYISITGEFVNSTIIKVKDANCEALILEKNYDENIIYNGYNYIKNITFLGPNSNNRDILAQKNIKSNITNSSGLKIYGLRTRIEDVQVEGFSNNGIEILSAYYTFLNNCFVRNNGIGILIDKESTSVYLTKSEVRHNSIGIYITGRSFANFINDNMIENNLAGYLVQDKTSQLSNLKSNGRAVVIDGASNNIITNNYFEQHYVSISVKDSYNNLINNNFFAVTGDTANNDKNQTLYQLSGSSINNIFEKNVTINSLESVNPNKIKLGADSDYSRNTIDTGVEGNTKLKEELLKNKNSSFRSPKIPN